MGFGPPNQALHHHNLMKMRGQDRVGLSWDGEN